MKILWKHGIKANLISLLNRIVLIHEDHVRGHLLVFII